MRLGKLELVARNTPSTKGQLWKITKLNLSNRRCAAALIRQLAESSTAATKRNLLINTNINNLGTLLNRLDMQNLSSPATVRSTVIYPGSALPSALTPRAFDGELNIDLKRGEILKDPTGPGCQTIVSADTAVFNTLPDP